MRLKELDVPTPNFAFYDHPSDENTDFKEKLANMAPHDDNGSELELLQIPESELLAQMTAAKEKDIAEHGGVDPLQETEDHIVVNGREIKKPFVEKPIFAEDHNIAIYYLGGGCKRLFRKIQDRSSRFFSGISIVRRGASYIYEEYIPTNGADVKVYTVGAEYAHAEARKSPAVDGKVTRRSDGKEVRYPIILTNSEKDCAHSIVLAFGQSVCGFDVLRTETKSFVCDVNGWSFVKGSPKYYTDCAQVLYEMTQFQLHPAIDQYNMGELLAQMNQEELEVVSKSVEPRWRELRNVLAVIRHADRTPKQKIKVKTSHPFILKFFDHKKPTEQVKLKTASELRHLLSAMQKIIAEVNTPKDVPIDPKVLEAFMGVQDVLMQDSNFEGINRKCQLKPLKWQQQEEEQRVKTCLLIFKYGGELTDLGGNQASVLGKKYRALMYPSDALSMLSLHSTYIHDLKIYASDEGRVQTTAAYFARSFLDLDEETDIKPILFALVWRDARSNMLLEHSVADSERMKKVKTQLVDILNCNIDFSELNTELDPNALIRGVPVHYLRKTGLGALGNPTAQAWSIYEKIKKICADMQELLASSTPDPERKRVLEQMSKLWNKIRDVMYNAKTGMFDESKFPETLDCAHYDFIHHSEYGINFEGLIAAIRPLATWLVRQEYGISEGAKEEIGKEIAEPLVTKLLNDLVQMKEERKQVETTSRFYFTSEGHIHSLLNLLESRLGIAVGTTTINYSAQILIKMFENTSLPHTEPRRFEVEIWVSPGFQPHKRQPKATDKETWERLSLKIVRTVTLDDLLTCFSDIQVTGMPSQQKPFLQATMV
eukprot:TRINITY_DN1149_c0_g1_i1.p1 TRINITY_DN1149_c0_g1~~TRINITY_DN1149_c0_g1_i1.p1  ORF type:complete len:826 (-),score=234.40 TRINITY_DN1149_c0_g1_i1:59-2536(-)